MGRLSDDVTTGGLLLETVGRATANDLGPAVTRRTGGTSGLVHEPKVT
jgi:hypothetical protein